VEFPLLTGDTYSSTPNKPRGTEEEAWNAVITDLEYARDNLSWDPWKGNTGRITLGMVKAYLAQAYMYNNRFADAKKELKDIIDSQRYSLNPCFAYIHLAGEVWQKESVWEIAYPQWPYMGLGAESSMDAVWWPAQIVTGEILPNNYCIKFWKESPDVPYCAIPITYMRLAGVMLNYAECCFETNDMAEGWKYIKIVRDRAWGNLEPQATPNSYHPVTLNTDPSVVAPLDAEYPKNSIPEGADCIHTTRAFDFDPTRMLFPIPLLEMEINKALTPQDQNPEYF